MRVVFTSWAWPSHLYAQVPLAWAFRAAGHEVVFAGQPALAGDIRRAGLPAAVVGTDVDTVGMVREYLTPGPATDGRTPSDASRPKGPRALRMLLAHAESMAEDLTHLVRGWRADLVVYDQTALAGPLAAAAAGIPAVRHLYGIDLLLRARALLPGALAPLADRLGVESLDALDGFDAFGAVTVDPVPASLQRPGDIRRLPMRHLPYNGPETASWSPPAPRDRPTRARVCVSWGHTIAKLDRSRFLAGRLASMLAEQNTGPDVEVVLAISAAQRNAVGPVPANVRIVVDVPLWQVLRDCDVFVGHGGAGGILTALGCGLPMLLVPQLPDHAGNAERVAVRGAAIVLDPDDLAAATVRDRVARLLANSDENRERRAAGELRAEMIGQPTPAEVVAALAELR